MRLWIAMTAVWLGMLTYPSWAEELPEPMMMPINKGMICDTLDQAKRQIDAWQVDTAGTGEMVEGCGYVQRPLLVLITPLETYRAAKTDALMARFDVRFKDGTWTQYGYITWTERAETAELPI